MATTVSLTGNITDMAGIPFSAINTQAVRGYAQSTERIVTDLDTNQTRLGRLPLVVAKNGDFTLPGVPATGDDRWMPEIAGWRLVFEWNDQSGGPGKYTTPWFELASTSTFAEVIFINPTAIDPQFLLDLDAALASATAAEVAAEAAQAAAEVALGDAEVARDETQTLRDGIVGDLGSTDSQVATLAVPGSGSLLDGVLGAGYVGVGEINVDVSRYASLQAAHDDAPTGSVLHIPPGDRVDDLLTVTKRITLSGPGGSDDGTSGGMARFISTSATADLITTAADGVIVEGVKLINTAGTVTAGAGIKVLAGDGAKVRNVSITGFWIGLDIADGVAWLLEDFVIRNFGKYGLRVKNTLADGGDQMISNGLFSASTGTRQPDAAVRYESGGGLKVDNMKIIGAAAGPNQIDVGFDMAWTLGPSGVLLMSIVSIERVAQDAVRLDAGDVGFGFATFDTMEIGLLDNTTGSAFKLTKNGTAGLSHVIVDDIVVQQTGGQSSGYLIDATGVGYLSVGHIIGQPTMAGRVKATNCPNLIDNSAPSRRAKMVTGRYYSPVGGTPSTAATAINTAVALPYMVPAACLLDRIAVEVTTAAASGTCRLGIYADDNGTPGALLLDAGTVDTSTTGAKEITISKRLDSGLVWLVATNQGAAATLRAVSGVQAPEGIGAISVADFATPFTGYYRNGVGGALPTTFGTPGGITAAAARVSVRAA